jgi:hypothetical protein
VGLGEVSRGGERRSGGSSVLRRRKVEEDEVFPDSTAAQQVDRALKEHYRALIHRNKEP